MEVFTESSFIPLAIGFFGLGTGYFIWGGQALFGFPKGNDDVDPTVGTWGFWMPGFMQFMTGVYIMVGLTWFQVFSKEAPLYMAALAFSAYGIHWFAMAHRKYKGYSEVPDGWMAIPFALISILGMIVFFGVADAPVGILFVGLTLIYLSEIPAKFTGSPKFGRLVGLWQFLTGIWLMYLTYAAVINMAMGGSWWL
ncbi:MAG TPA: hypothetical protein VFK33_00590 [Bacillales bacterium]|nr:hypothetical protein [Bacillales bacterium]